MILTRLRTVLSASHIGRKAPTWTVAVTVIVCLGAMPAAAAGHAKTKVYVPPGVSSASEYAEIVPTAAGNVPTAQLPDPQSGLPAASIRGCVETNNEGACILAAEFLPKKHAGDAAGSGTALATVLDGGGSLATLLIILGIVALLLLSLAGILARRRRHQATT